MIFYDKRLNLLVLAHIILICLSNILVQYPFVLLSFRTTYGAFAYPFIFILTDLTVRLLDKDQAKKIIILAMLPALIGSYFIANYYRYGELFLFNGLGLRVAFASFSAYVFGQLLDISIFQRLRKKPQWWLAPSVSTIFGNLFDTYLFFFIAFYQSSDVFLAKHWQEIATVDLVFKLCISLLTFIPLYGVLLRFFTLKRLKKSASSA